MFAEIKTADLRDAYVFWENLGIDRQTQQAQLQTGNSLLKVPPQATCDSNLAGEIQGRGETQGTGEKTTGPACSNADRIICTLTSQRSEGEGFIETLRQLCEEANIFQCDMDECKQRRDAIAQTAPKCTGWDAFRDWAIVLMSCCAFHPWKLDRPKVDQSEVVQIGLAAMHAPDVVGACCRLLKDFAEEDKPGKKSSFYGKIDKEGLPSEEINVGEVINTIYWMAVVQTGNGVGPNIGRWDHNYLPLRLVSKNIKQALNVFNESNVCKRRLWRVIDASPRKTWDIPDIIEVFKDHIQSFQHSEHGEDRHDECTPGTCQIDTVNTTKVKQTHKTGCPLHDKPYAAENDDSCPPEKFDEKKLCEALLEKSTSLTAWTADCQLATERQKYIAISHVWSDGTGVGLREPGSVNGCLFKYFMSIATRLGCEAVWWDAVSVPSEKRARAAAIKSMADQYAKASYTVVHDAHLLNFPWSKGVEGRRNGGPCLALVLSSWFTRGWTAVELALSKKVKVLFKGKTEDTPEIVDLEEILASDPRTYTRGHWLATQLIQRLRQPIHNVGDLLAILSQRITSWQKDRAEISAILAGVADYGCDSTASQITKKTIIHLGEIPHACLLHDISTMNIMGEFSWCPATMDNMPFDISADMRGGINAEEQAMLEVDPRGVATGMWRYLMINRDDVRELRVTPLGHDPAATFRAVLTLEDPGLCLLLRPFTTFDGRAVLVTTYPTDKNAHRLALSCCYVATVTTHRLSDKDKKWNQLPVRLGEEISHKPILAMKAINDLKKALQRKEKTVPPKWIQEAHPRTNLKDEVAPWSSKRGFGIKYVDEILPQSDDRKNKNSIARFFTPDMQDLDSALRQLQKGEAAVRWILLRKPTLVATVVDRLTASEMDKELRRHLSESLLKIVASREYDVRLDGCYRKLIPLCEDGYVGEGCEAPQFIQDARKVLMRTKPKRRTSRQGDWP